MRDATTAGLRLITHRVTSVTIGSETRYERGALTVASDDAKRALADAALADVRISWASPGESVRIIKLLDAVEPRTKGRGGAGVFPGFVSPAKPQGRGETHRLDGVAVVAAGYLPRAQEAVVDMSGPGARRSPFGSLHNLVVEFTPTPDAPWEDVDAALRRGLLALATRMAEAALGAPPDAVDELPWLARAAGTSLPRVGAITNLQTQGSFKDVFVYGRSLSAALPTLIDPNEVEDGAVVSGQFGHPALKNPTYLHQNHPVARELRRRDGRDLEFAGIVLAPEPVEAQRKELVAAHAARLCALARFDAVVITKEGGGNADADVSLKLDALDELGIAGVGLFAEMAGADGTAPSLVIPPERATGMISTGNYDEIVPLPAVERALGGDAIDLVGAPAASAVELPTAVLYCALSPMGAGHLTCREGG